jgi:hypothetical protein
VGAGGRWWKQHSAENGHWALSREQTGAVALRCSVLLRTGDSEGQRQRMEIPVRSGALNRMKVGGNAVFEDTVNGSIATRIDASV